MGFIISSFPIDVRTGNGDLTDAQKDSFAGNFQLVRSSGAGANGNIVVWQSGKLADGGTLPSVANFISKKGTGLTGKLASFTADGDIQSSGKSVSDFALAADLGSYATVHNSLSAIGITSMDSANWAANAEAIKAALQVSGGSLEIPNLTGLNSAYNALASSIAYEGTNGGYGFNPKDGRFVARIAQDPSGYGPQLVFESWRSGRYQFCSSRDGEINWKWFEMQPISAGGSTDKPRTKCINLDPDNSSIEVYIQRKNDIIYINGYTILSGPAVVNNPIFQIPADFPAPPPAVIVEFSYENETRMLRCGGFVAGDNDMVFYLDRTKSGSSVYRGGVNLSYPADWNA